MRTRTELCYRRADVFVDKIAVKRRDSFEDSMECRKRQRFSSEVAGNSDLFNALPDDLVISILCKLSSSARCASDFIKVLITCKRLNSLALNSLVLSKASPKMFDIKAKSWSESAHRFFKSCADAGNIEACYTLGTILFYCLHKRGSGASLMAKAAISSHALALYSLAVIQFNGSGGSKIDKNLRAGVALCARAAFLGHIDALRELGHCLQDGYGVRQNIADGRRFLIRANILELATILSATDASNINPTSSWVQWRPNLKPDANQRQPTVPAGFSLLSDYGCNVPAPEAHPASRFLAEWFASREGTLGPGLGVCSHEGCRRPETRKHEFRRCSVCGAVNYCSRACQALDWKLRHKAVCAAVGRGLEEDGGGGEGNVAVHGNDDIIANS